jgi:hypothetical protein
MSQNLPPAPSHILCLNWYLPKRQTEMAFSVEDHLYIALYGTWKTQAESQIHGNWASSWVQKMNHLSTGIQLADEGLHKRTAQFVSPPHLQKLDEIRTYRDSEGLFNTWYSRPKIQFNS